MSDDLPAAPAQAPPARSGLARLWAWLRLALTFGAILGLVLFLRDNADALAVFADLDLKWLLVVGVAYSGLVATRAIGLKLSHYQVLPSISFARWWAIAVVTGALNHLLPSSAGGAWRALTLKLHRRVALSDSLAIQLWLFTSMLLTGGIALAIGLWQVEIAPALQQSLLLLAALAIVISSAALLLAHRAARISPPEDDASLPRWRRVLARARAIGITYPAMLKVIINAALNLLLGALAVYAGYAATGIELPLFVALIFGAMLTLSTLFVVTPGNIGIIEGVVGMMAALIGRDIEAAITAMLVVRVLNLASVLVPMPFALLILRRWEHKHEPR